MTTFLFFAELLVKTPYCKPNRKEDTATDKLYKGILKNTKCWYYRKWAELEKM